MTGIDRLRVLLWLRSRVPGSRWTSFVADPDRRRILHEDGNVSHRLRVEALALHEQRVRR